MIPASGTPPIEARVFLDRAAALTANREAAALDLWELLAQPVVTASAPVQAQVDEARSHLRRALVQRLARANPDAVRRFLEGALVTASARYEAIARGADLDAVGVASALHELASDLLWLRSRLDEVTEDADHDSLSDVVVEIDECLQEARQLDDALPEHRPPAELTASILHRAEHLSLAALRRRIEDLESAVAAVANGDQEHSFIEIWDAFLTASELESEVLALDVASSADLSDEVRWADEHRRKIRDRVERTLGELEPPYRRVALERLAIDLADRSEETLVKADEAPPARALVELVEVEAELAWGRATMDAHEPGLARARGWRGRLRLRRRNSIERADHALGRAHRRVIAEHVEKTVSARMEAMLGRGLTAAIENLILVLIFLFIFLLWAESSLTPRPGLTQLVEDEAMSSVARHMSAVSRGIESEESGGELDLERIELETMIGIARSEGLPTIGISGGASPADAMASTALEIAHLARVAHLVHQAELAEEARLEWWHRFFAIADLIIGLIFIFEFCFKFALAPRRLNYFRRHFLIDFLPSIPFGYISWSVTQAFMPGGAESARSVRALRLLRMPRLVRYLRLARPFVRMFRVVTFALRGLDRLVRRYAPLLNRQVVFFEPMRAAPAQRLLRERFIDLEGRVNRRYRAQLGELEARERAPLIDRRVRELEEHLPYRRPGTGARYAIRRGVGAGAREINADDLIRGMVKMDATNAEDVLGRDLVMRLRKIVGLLAVPGVRRLPVIRDLHSGLERLDPYEVVAQAIRVFGRLAQRILERIYAYSDLYGIVTAPQLLDRVGGALVKALGRPAKRLIIFGMIFFIINLFLGVFEQEEAGFLHSISEFFGRILSTAFLVLGAICLAPLLLGIWLRHIAGEASDFYERAVEAQFLPLFRGVKQETLEQDLRILHGRVLLSEQLLFGPHPTADETAADLAMIEASFRGALPHRTPMATSTHASMASFAAPALHLKAQQRVLELYRDYLEGTPLHLSDVKVANLFLGNLDMDNVHRERLRMPRRDLKRLERLDLARERSILGGPHMWFNFVTDGVAQRVAKLMIDYNQHCLPLEESQLATTEEQARFKAWLTKRRLRQEIVEIDTEIEPAPSPERHANERGGRPAYVTTAFSALHFITEDEERDRLVGMAFGDDVLAQLERDRKHVIRSVFGSYPLPSLPRAQRTLNPYRIYLERMAGGLIFLLPFVMFWWWARLMLWMIKVLLRNIREILQPSFASHDPRSSYASYEVAERKIFRMRKPIVLAAMETRARFDPEYLGLTLAGGSDPEPDATVHEDLDAIRALDQERAVFERLLRQSRPRHKRFLALMAAQGFDKSESAERLRAMSIVHHIDYRDAASLLEADDRIAGRFREAIHRCATEESKPTIWRRVGNFMARRDRNFEEYWRYSEFKNESKAAYEICRRVARVERSEIGRLLALVARAGGALAAKQRGMEILLSAARRPGAFSEQLVTVRTVQVLAMLDIECYRRIVMDLGGFAASEGGKNGES